MNYELILIPALPFAGTIILAIFGGRFSKTLTAIIGAGTIGLSALFTILIGYNFLSSPPPSGSITQSIWVWMETAGFKADIAFRLDSLSLAFIFIITFVGFLIHLYSVEYMREEEGYSRFFTYMNLFVGSMLTLVLADNLVLLYLGWEGVGLCSYLLIGFFYKAPENNYAARKAFIITRIGDTTMLIAIFILFWTFGTLNIQEIMTKAPLLWSAGSTIATVTALMLLGGALGKSAQLPFQTWLPDAMAGPSPVSALIHAATMVTAGVYLITRLNVIFTLSPLTMSVIAVIGTLTLLIAGFSAITQRDIKRVLAYSTISQIGYMFLALGVGAFSAGVFHFMIHAFFKALLFLGAGAVIMSLHHEQDMFKMGGLKNKIPLIYWTFLIGSASLAALPLVTAGFYSKDTILWDAFDSSSGSVLLWAGAVIGAFITAFYSFRMIFLTFFGEEKTHVHYLPGKIMTYPLVILAVLSVAGGFIELPNSLGNLHLFSGFMKNTLPEVKLIPEREHYELILQILTSLIALSGVYLAYIIFIKHKGVLSKVQFSVLNSPFLNSGFGFDKLYNDIIVKPIVYFSEINKNDFIDYFINGISSVSRSLNKIFAKTQTGLIRNYVTGIVIGIIIILTLIILV